MMRSIPLRGFDQDCAKLIVNDMKHHGTKIHQDTIPVKIEKGERLKVTFEKDQKLESEEFDTVMFAVGRKGVSAGMNLKEVGVKLDKNDKIIVNEYEQTSVPNIYALGDIRSGGIELTPVAIMSGSILAKNLYGKTAKTTMNYDLVPSTVFTPLEYGTCGLSEEEAIKRHGKDNIEVYHVKFDPLEHHLSRHDNRSYMKMVCLKSQNEKVIGFHILSPNAGEVTQGVAVAMKMGACKKDFDETVGIHPTIAEEITINRITKSSGDPYEKGGC